MQNKTKYKAIDKDKLEKAFERIKIIQDEFYKEFKVDDIFSNSKMFEIIIANALGHILIPGHSGSRDAKDDTGEFEYKHFKETSSNHSWTFNDYTDNTIRKLKKIKAVIFAHIDDTETPIILDWYYKIPGAIISSYLEKETKHKKNTRKMINVSPRQIEKKIGFQKETATSNKGNYDIWLEKVFKEARIIESISNTTGILTSNKVWEVLVASELNHNVNSEQGGRRGSHDAFDCDNNLYEYKVAKSYSWNFQDISDQVLNKYLEDKKVILAKVDKNTFRVEALYSAEPKQVVFVLRKKLKEKTDRLHSKGEQLRRKQVSLSKSDLVEINADQIK